MRVLSDDGVALAAECDGRGTPFLMVHGFTGAKEDFTDHAPCFATHTTVVTFDHDFGRFAGVRWEQPGASR